MSTLKSWYLMIAIDIIALALFAWYIATDLSGSPIGRLIIALTFAMWIHFFIRDYKKYPRTLDH